MLREEATQELFEGYEFNRELADSTKKHTSFPTNSTEENVRRR